MQKVSLFPTSELSENEVRLVEIDGYPPIAIYNLAGDFFATDDTCTHGNASMSEGDIDAFPYVHVSSVAKKSPAKL